jgi:hypothetical protein
MIPSYSGGSGSPNRVTGYSPFTPMAAPPQQQTPIMPVPSMLQPQQQPQAFGGDWTNHLQTLLQGGALPGAAGGAGNQFITSPTSSERWVSGISNDPQAAYQQQLAHWGVGANMPYAVKPNWVAPPRLQPGVGAGKQAFLDAHPGYRWGQPPG